MHYCVCDVKQLSYLVYKQMSFTFILWTPHRNMDPNLHKKKPCYNFLPKREHLIIIFIL